MWSRLNPIPKFVLILVLLGAVAFGVNTVLNLKGINPESLIPKPAAKVAEPEPVEPAQPQERAAEPAPAPQSTPQSTQPANAGLSKLLGATK